MRSKIKICGLFRSIDIEYVNEIQPDYAGFVLAPGFRRSISKEQAARFRQKLDRRIPVAGVFVNAPCEEIISLLREDIIQMAQLHGEETEEIIQYIRAVTGKPVLKAVKVHDRADIEAWLDSSADHLLFDSGTGTGKAFDWKLLENVPRQYFLAGGLNAGNLEKALEMRPYAVDLSSGVETDGVKDREKIRTVVEMVRAWTPAEQDMECL